MVDPPKADSPKEQLSDEIGRRAERKQRAREQNKHTAWFGLGMFGLVGWSVAIPTLLGIALGLWLDARWPGRVSWTLTFLIIGVILGCLNAWYWVKQESGRE
ncbi:MAG: AtpZ/AtpI family protein [Granulosicoccaceae bacterium]|jgi:ATP synthase protein I